MDNARELSTHLRQLLRREQASMADFLVALADFDRKRIWVDLGYSSLFYFLHRELGLSSGAAYYRKAAAELIQRFPEVVEPLRDGRLCITGIAELSKVMTPENRTEVLPRFFHASKQEAKAVAAEISPREAAPHRSVVTALAPVVQARQAAKVANGAGASPLVAAPPLALGQPFHPVETDPTRAPVTDLRPAALAPERPQPASAEPFTADLRRLHVTVSKRFTEKLEAARDALSHSRPGADVEAILEAGLDLVIERAAKRRGLVKRPRAVTGGSPGDASNDPRHVPAAVQREVMIRDEGRCQWRTADGGICGSTHRIELDHVVPVGKGGKSTAENLRVTCAFHNDLAAREVYGDRWMDRFTRRADRQPTQALPGA